MCDSSPPLLPFELCARIFAQSSVRQRRESWSKSVVSAFVTTMASKAHWEFGGNCGGPCHCFGRDNSTEAQSRVILFEGGPPATAAQGSSFFTVVGRAGVPATLHARPASFILCEINTAPPFRKIYPR